MPDGRLGLIDYGQVKRVNKGARVAYAKLTLAILAEDKEEVARLLRSDPPEGFGGKSRFNDVDVAYRLCVFWNDRDTPDVTGGLNLQEFIDEMEARDPVRVAPLDMVMISRVSVLLRGGRERVQRAVEGGEGVGWVRGGVGACGGSVVLPVSRRWEQRTRAAVTREWVLHILFQ